MNPDEYAENRNRERKRQYYLANRERLLAYQKQYDQDHRAKKREYHRRYMADYRKGILRRKSGAEEE